MAMEAKRKAYLRSGSIGLDDALEKKKKKKKSKIAAVESIDPSNEEQEQQQKKKRQAKARKNESNCSKSEVDGDIPSGDAAPDLPKPKKAKLVAEVAAPTGLEIYWKLPSLDPAERRAAALALVKELQAAQQAFDVEDSRVENGAEVILLGEAHSDSILKSCAPELQYALPRLVRGVGSSNQCARQGFAAALATVIHALSAVTGDLVLNLIEKEIEVSSSLKKQDLKDALLGRLFAYASIVRAGRLIGNGTTDEQQKLAKNVAEKLLTLGFKKTFLREPAVSVFLELSERLDLSTLQSSVFTLPIFREWLDASPEVGGADALLLALKVGQKLPKDLSSNCRMLPNSGALKDIIQTSHLDVLIPYLKESSLSHPRLHLVWDALVQVFVDQGIYEAGQKRSKRKTNATREDQNLITFWTRMVDENLLTSSHERKFLAMRLVLLFLSKLPSSCAPIILSPTFGRCVMDILSGQGNILHKSSQQFISDLCEWAEEKQDNLVLTIGFLQQISSGKFDHLTKSSTVKQLLGKVSSEDSCLVAIQNLQRLFISDDINVPGDTDDSVDAKRILASKKIWMVDLMCSFCKQAVSLSHSMTATKEVTRFLAANIFRDGDGVKRGKVEALVKCASGEVSEAVKDECVRKLRALLSERSPHEDLGYDLVLFFRTVWKKPEKLSVERMLKDAIFQSSAAISKEEKPDKKLVAMRSLLSQLFIQSQMEPGSLGDIVTELIICCKKAFGKIIDVAIEDADTMGDDEDAPLVEDVLLDVILSLLSQSPAPIRVAAEQLFELFCGDITASGLSSMLKVISKHTGRTRQEPLFEIEDDDEEDVLSVEEVTEDEVSEVSDLETEEGEGVGDKQQTDNQIQGAMDDAELSDMDDETMFKMDAHLAQILKAKKRGGESDGQTQLLQFKSRVLGLLDTYLQKQSENVTVLVVLPALFQSYLHASLDGHKQLCDRLAGILNRVLKAKNYPKGADVDIAVVKDLLQKLLLLASRTTDQKLRGLAQGFVFWLLKVSQASSADDEVVAAMISTVDDIFRKKKTTLPLSFLRDGATRYPWLRRVFVGKLVEKCKDGRTDYEKAEAMDLVSSLLKQSRANDAAMAEDIKPHLPVLKELLVSHFVKPLKKTKQASFFRLCVSTLEALRLLFPERSLGDLIDTAAMSSAVANYAFSGNVKSWKTKLESLLQA